MIVQLNLRAGVPGGLALFRHAEHNAAVFALAHVEFELELEPIELLVGHDIASAVGIFADKNAILHLPPLAHGLRLEIMPAPGGLAVEEQLPSCPLFGWSNAVDRGLMRRRGDDEE